MKPVINLEGREANNQIYELNCLRDQCAALRKKILVRILCNPLTVILGGALAGGLTYTGCNTMKDELGKSYVVMASRDKMEEKFDELVAKSMIYKPGQCQVESADFSFSGSNSVRYQCGDSNSAVIECVRRKRDKEFHCYQPSPRAGSIFDRLMRGDAGHYSFKK